LPNKIFIMTDVHTFKLAVMPGDGIGPEVMAVTLPLVERVIRDAGHAVTFTEADVGGIAIDNHGKALPEETLAVARASDAILFGSIGGPKWETLPPAEQPERAALLPLRKAFSLFANLRPGKLPVALAAASPIRPERFPNGIDMLCVRELTGGLYFGQPKETRGEPGNQSALDTCIYHESEIVRITEVAVAAARQRRMHITLVDKANVMETSQLWRRVVKKYLAENAPELTLSYLYVDNAAMQLISNPGQFDVILTENLFGDILSDEMACVCGSLGMMASASLGANQNRLGFSFGLYEPAGGSAPDIAGKGVANPCAQVLSAALLLRYSLGLAESAARLEAAVDQAVRDGVRTADIAFGAPSVGTAAMAKAIAERL
jgi:3-isopropylmalate dehydrogenase